MAFTAYIIDDCEADALLNSENVQYYHGDARIFFPHSYDEQSLRDFAHCRGEYSKNPSPDLVIIDINLGVISGFDLLGCLRKIHPNAVIIMSSGMSKKYFEEIYERMRKYWDLVDAYIPKGVRGVRSQEIREVFESRAKHKEAAFT